MFSPHQAWVVLIAFCIVLSIMMGFSARGDLIKKSSRRKKNKTPEPIRQSNAPSAPPQNGIDLANTGIGISLIVMLCVAVHIIAQQ